MTFCFHGSQPTFLGEGDLHERDYSDKARRVSFFASQFGRDNARKDQASGNACLYWIDLYPSKAFGEAYESQSALIVSASLGGTFLLVAIVFFVYDYVVGSQNRKVAAEAAKSGALVNSLFPEVVREQLMASVRDESRHLGDGGTQDPKEKPTTRTIATHYPESTVCFADIRNFTSWSR